MEVGEGTIGKEEGLIDRFKRLIRRSGKAEVQEVIVGAELKQTKGLEGLGAREAREKVIKDAGFNLPKNDATRPLSPLDPPEPPENKILELQRETNPWSTAETKPLNPQVVEKHEQEHPEDAATNPIEPTSAFVQSKLEERWRSTGPKPLGSTMNTPYVDTRPQVPISPAKEQPTTETVPQSVEDKTRPISTIDNDTKKGYRAP